MDNWKGLGICAKYYKYCTKYPVLIGLFANLLRPRTDVTKEDQLTEAFDKVIEDFGRIDNWYDFAV